MPPSPKFPSLIANQYNLTRLITEGNMAWAIEAVDTHHHNQKTFIKYYKSPTLSIEWYYDYVNHVNQLNKRLEESSAAKYCVLSKHLFSANPKPGMCPHEFLYQAFDFIESGYDLKQLLEAGDISWEKRKTMAKVFLAAMKKIHGAGVVHTDLKPENIQMLPDSGTKLGLIPRMIDMDRSIIQGVPAPWTKGEHKEGYTGTPDYFSPEHLTGKMPELASDVFTMGLILGELLGGKHPFSRAQGDQALYRKLILEGHQYEPVRLFGDLGNIPHNTRQYEALIHSCFEPDMSKRPTSAYLHSCLLKLDKGETLQIDVELEDSNPHQAPSPVPEVSPSVETPLTPVSEQVPPPPPPVTQNGHYPLILTGDLGSIQVKLNMTVGREFLSSISSEAKYASKQQFLLNFDKKRQCWVIFQALGKLVNLTAVNGKKIENVTQLNMGDEIALMSQSSERTAMKITVSR